MIVTTWDGHLRLDRPPGGGTVTLTLLTVEPTTEGRLRPGLVAGFVTEDPAGPPALVTVDTPRGTLPDDVATLVGPRIAGALGALDPGPAGEWLQLDLAEVGDLAAAWAPYRNRVLAGDPAPAAAGSWIDGLWTRLDLPDLRSLLGGGPEPVFRGDGPPGPGPAAGAGAAGQWLLPAALAASAGCDPAVRWTVRPGPGDAVRLGLEAVRTGPDRGVELLAAVDEPGGTWTPLSPDGDRLRAELVLPGPEVPALRFRTRPAGRS